MHTYLECSDDTGSGHQFYEARVEGTTLTLRSGDTGTEGQTQTLTFATAEEAMAEAEKQLAEQRQKGYVDAVPGGRNRRAVPEPASLPDVFAPYREALEATRRPYVALRGVKAPAQP